MMISSTTLTEHARSVRLLRIHGCPPYPSIFPNSEQCVTSRWDVGGYEWETRFYPTEHSACGFNDMMALELVFLSDSQGTEVTASLSCRLVDPSGIVEPSGERVSRRKSFSRPWDSSGKLVIMTRLEAYPDYLIDDGSVTLECTLTVFREEEGIVPWQLQPAPDHLHDHLGELLRSEAGADVTFVVAGERVAAHKSVLVARSPVFKALFSDDMRETVCCRRLIEVKDMEPAVFKAMLGFIYTDRVPGLDDETTQNTVMGQHLLVAADRYGLDRLKGICECRIARGVDAATAAAALALADRHGCSLLKARCVEFITGGSAEILAAILATDGFKCLEASSPSMLTELLKAAHERIKELMGLVRTNNTLSVRS